MRLSTLLLIAIISACATSYQKLGSTGGYSETALAENVYRVNFAGNAYTSLENSDDYTLLRCAELTLEKNYKYFIIVDSNRTSLISVMTTPTKITGSGNTYGSITTFDATVTGGETHYSTRPLSSNLIRMFKDKPSGFYYDAAFIQKSIKEKYDLR